MSHRPAASGGPKGKNKDVTIWLCDASWGQDHGHHLIRPTKLGWQRHLMTQSLSLRTRTRSTSTPIATSPRGILNTWLRRISRNTTLEIGFELLLQTRRWMCTNWDTLTLPRTTGEGEDWGSSPIFWYRHLR